MHYNRCMRSYKQHHDVMLFVSRISFPVVMYFFRVFGIINDFKLTFLARLEKDSEMVLTKSTVKYLLESLVRILVDLIRMEFNSLDCGEYKRMRIFVSQQNLYPSP